MSKYLYSTVKAHLDTFLWSQLVTVERKWSHQQQENYFKKGNEFYEMIDIIFGMKLLIFMHLSSEIRVDMEG